MSRIIGEWRGPDGDIQVTVQLSPSEAAKQRVEQELKELTERVEKLCAFIASPKFLTISGTQQTLLREQLTAMEKYESTLKARLSVWGK